MIRMDLFGLSVLSKSKLPPPMRRVVSSFPPSVDQGSVARHGGAASAMQGWLNFAKVTGWLGRRKPELAIFCFGVLLRLTMRWTYGATWSYDSQHHFAVVQWILDHGRVPSPTATFSSFHPPLFYATAAWFLRHGVRRAALVWFSLAWGTIRLALVWAGLELYLPSMRWARVSALALAAVTAASIHI